MLTTGKDRSNSPQTVKLGEFEKGVAILLKISVLTNICTTHSVVLQQLLSSICRLKKNVKCQSF